MSITNNYFDTLYSSLFSAVLHLDNNSLFLSRKLLPSSPSCQIWNLLARQNKSNFARIVTVLCICCKLEKSLLDFICDQIFERKWFKLVLFSDMLLIGPGELLTILGLHFIDLKLNSFCNSTNNIQTYNYKYFFIFFFCPSIAVWWTLMKILDALKWKQ